MKQARCILDIVLAVLLVAMMAYTLTGNAVHEYLGIAFFVLGMAHCVLNRKWFRALPVMLPRLKGRPKQIVWVATNLLLTAAMLVCAVTSVIISVQVFAFLNIPYLGEAWATVHTVSAFIILGCGAIHFGLHGKFFASALKGKAGKPQARRPRPRAKAAKQPVMAVLAIALVLVGLASYETKDLIALAAPRVQGQAGSSQGVALEVTDTTASGTPATQPAQAYDAAAQQAASATQAMEETAAAASAEQATPAVESEEASNPLEGQICTLCKKMCPLAAPLCDRGVQLAQQMLASLA